MDSSYEAGLTGQARPAGGNFDSWQQGASVNAANTAELARQASAGIPGTGGSWDFSSPSAPSAGSWNIGGPSIGGGQWIGGAPAARAFLATLIALPSLLLAVFLYPLASVAGAGMLALAGLFAQQPALVLLFGGGSIPIFWMICRLDQRWGELAAYRSRRHLVRLLIVAAVPVVSVLDSGPVPGVTESVLMLAIRLATGAAIGLVLMVPAHFILKSTWLRTGWHGALELVRLRPAGLGGVESEPKLESA